MAAGLLWVTGLVGMGSSYAEVSYLRGDPSALSQFDRNLFDATRPLLRLQLEQQRAYLVALGDVHERAFPVALANLFAQGLLVGAAGTLMFARRDMRRFAVQVLLGNVAMIVVTYVTLAPARYAAREAFTRGAAALRGLPEGPERPPDDALDFLVEHQPIRDGGRAAAEGALYLLAVGALYRRRTRAYFDALGPSRPVATDGGGGDDDHNHDDDDETGARRS